MLKWEMHKISSWWVQFRCVHMP